MKVLLVASELFPLVKTGGLADVAGSLPVAMMQQGCDVRVLLPNYPGILDKVENLEQGPQLGDPYGHGEISLLSGQIAESGLELWLVDSPALFNRPGTPYLGLDGYDYQDNHKRFGALSWAGAVIAQHGRLLNWQPDLVHCNDWQTGLLPAYLKIWSQQRPAMVFTIHNLLFSGIFDYFQYRDLGLPDGEFRPDGMEFFGRLSMLKSGIQYSDAITTVSPNYAKEIQTPEFGCGLDGLLRHRSDHLSGILNGVDYHIWSPENDPYLAAPYFENHQEPKQLNKIDLQNRFGLDQDPNKPLFGVVSRMSEQKGLDLVLEVLPYFIHKGAQFVILGSGDRILEEGFQQIAVEYPKSVATTIGYDEQLSHRIQGGCDFFLVPSRFEPCGLTQMYALKYGTLPIVRHTGGLADTVWEGTYDDAMQTGFVFGKATGFELSAALDRAMQAFRNPGLMHKLRIQAMRQNFSWDRAAGNYLALYRSVLYGV